MMHCGCGNLMQTENVTVEWMSHLGQRFTIRNVPCLQCANRECNEVYYTGDVEFSLAVLAEEMETGLLPKQIVFQSRFAG